MSDLMDEEKQVIAMCLAGDIETFAMLVNRYEANVKALAWNITGSSEDAREISQDTFLQAFQNLRLFDQNKPFKNWILGITIKRSLDKIRKQKTFLNFFKQYSREVPTAKEEIRPIEESPIFHPLLKRLNERERTALSLQVNENYTAKEIGQLLNCSENSVRVTLFKAKKKLRKGLRIADNTNKEQSNSANPGKTRKTNEVVP
jgi:RNA polymerase sigma factor (sigma-70 family)